MATTVESRAEQAVQARVASRNLPLALMALVLGVYLLTMSGHTYSSDEETLLDASRSLVLRGSWALTESQETGAKQYSPYGPGQSMAAVPWAALGLWMGSLFPSDQAGYPLRLILGSYNALIGAAICGLFAATGMALGYSRRTSLFAAGALAFATYLWPHSRTFFAEPLTALCLLSSLYLLLLSSSEFRIQNSEFRILRSSIIALPLLSGVLFAATVATKAQYVVALPAFVVYLVWSAGKNSEFRIQNSELGSPQANPKSKIQNPKSIVWWLLGLALGLVPLLLYNLAIFGDPLTTGYGTSLEGQFGTPLYEGAYGLLLSPGKGLLWYAPPVILAIAGVPAFARRHRAETAFVATLAVSLIVFFGLYDFWHGDGSWGPRYLIPLLPFAFLPALPVFQNALEPRPHPWRLAAVAVLVGAGFLVNVFGGLVNFGTYINSGYDDDTRHWWPYASPLVGHPRLFAQRAHVGDWLLTMAPQPGTIFLKSGFSYSEGDKARNELLPRWTTGSGSLEIWPDTSNGPVSVTLRLADHRPPELPRANVSLLVDGQPMPAETRPVADSPISTDYTVALNGSPTRLVIKSDTWNPLKQQGLERDEELGLRLVSIAVAEGGQPRAYHLVESLPAPPYYPSPRWHYDFDSRFPVDLWPVYLLNVGMGRKAMLGLALPIVLAGLLSMVFGLRGLMMRDT